mgnify:CR=1 FL=1
MDYKKAAQQVLDNIGGASNIVSAAHCATRLRLEVKDSSAVNEKSSKMLRAPRAYLKPRASCRSSSAPAL